MFYLRGRPILTQKTAFFKPQKIGCGCFSAGKIRAFLARKGQHLFQTNSLFHKLLILNKIK
jgi:hypothetical protein